MYLDFGLGLGGSRMHRLSFDWIKERTRGPIAGLAIRENCSLIFQPARKSHAWRCPACHGSPTRRAPLSEEDNARGGRDLAGLRGELALRMSWCLGCGEQFESRRPDADYCSDRCRKRIARGAAGASVSINDPWLSMANPQV